MSASNSTTGRDAIAQGDFLAWIESLAPDQIETVNIDIPGAPLIDATYTRIGRAQVAVKGDQVSVHVHETADEAAECFNWNVDRVRALKDAAAQGPMAMLMAMMSMLGTGEDDGETTVPLPAYQPASLPQRDPGATIREVAAGPTELTGFYL